MSGMKFDANKPRLDLLPFDSLESTAEVFAFGAAKYGEWNWEEIDDGVRRYAGSLLRHVSKFMQGEEYDADSSLHHLAHASACCLILLRFIQPRPADLDLDTVHEKYSNARERYQSDGRFDEAEGSRPVQ